MTRLPIPRWGALERCAFALLAYTVFVVLFGAYVRATGSGAGCGAHWPLCNGTVIPRTGSEKTWIEFTHRVTSGLCWWGALGLWLLVRRATPPGEAVRRTVAATLALMTTEALIGAGLVLFEKVATDASTARAVWMVLHLMNTFALLASLLRTLHLLRASRIRTTLRGQVQARGFSDDDTAGADAAWSWRSGLRAREMSWLAVLSGLLIVGASGAVAALGDTLFPASSLGEALRADWSPTAHLFVRLRVYHPLIAIAGLAGVFVFAGHGLSSQRGAARRFAALTLLLGSVQLILGAVNVLLLAPVPLQLAHLGLADLLWLAVLQQGFEESHGVTFDRAHARQRSTRPVGMVRSSA